ncbi:MAG TPA: putative Ig domain-containing protein [bacterium]
MKEPIRIRNLFVYLTLIIILFAVHCNGKGEQGEAQNTPPEVQTINIAPVTPTVQSEITVQITGFDKEGDPITYQVKWFINDREIGEGMSFKYEDIKTGDKIYAEVTPYDGKAYGKSKQSNSVTIGGQVPRILSVKYAPESVFVTTPTIALDAVIDDPDQDTVSLFCNWLIHDRVAADTLPTFTLSGLNLRKGDTIYASAYAWDKQGRSDPFEFAIVVSNAPPALQNADGVVTLRLDSLAYKIPITDPDNDPMTFELLRGPEGVWIDRNSGVLNGNPGNVNSLEVTVRATDQAGASLVAKFTLTSPE